MSRLDIGIKPQDVQFPEINKGLAYFVAPPDRAVDLVRLAQLLKQSGYVLRLARLDVEGLLDSTKSQIRIPSSGQVFALGSGKAAAAGNVRARLVWNAPDKKRSTSAKEVFDVESITRLP